MPARGHELEKKLLAIRLVPGPPYILNSDNISVEALVFLPGEGRACYGGVAEEENMRWIDCIFARVVSKDTSELPFTTCTLHV